MTVVEVFLLYLLHVCVWFVLSGIASVLWGRGGTLRMASAAGLGFFSFAAQMLARHLHLF